MNYWHRFGFLLLMIVVCGALFFPIFVLAQAGPPAVPVNPPAFKNPLGQGVTAVSFLGRVTNWLLGLVGFLALLALVVGGIRMIASFGNEQSVEKGKEIVKWAVIGLAVVTLSYVVIRITQQFLGVTQ